MVDTALAEEKRLRVEETKQLQDKLDEDVQRSNSLEQQLDELKKQPAQWLAELKWIDSEISSKPFSLFLARFILSYTGAGVHLTSPQISLNQSTSLNQMIAPAAR